MTDSSALRKPKARVYIDLAFVLAMADDWNRAAGTMGHQDFRYRVDVWRIVDLLRRTFTVKVATIYDAAPADGSPPRNAPIHQALLHHPLMRLDLRRSQHPPNFEQKQVDIKIARDMLRDAQTKSVTHMILVTGDDDFVPAIEGAREMGVSVTVAGFFSYRSNKDLRLAADDTIDLDDEPIVTMSWGRADQRPT